MCDFKKADGFTCPLIRRDLLLPLLQMGYG
jgi:hypothetical protein